MEYIRSRHKRFFKEKRERYKMKPITIYCYRPVRRFDKATRTEKYGCGWSREIKERNQMPSTCHGCGARELSIEENYQWHVICKMFARKAGWPDHSSTESLPQFLIVRSLIEKYYKYKSSLSDFNSILSKEKNNLNILGNDPREDQLMNIYFKSLGFIFCSSTEFNNFLSGYQMFDRLSKDFVEFYQKKQPVLPC